MDFFIFADGYLQENDNDFRYTVTNSLFHSSTFFKTLEQSNDSFGLELIDIQRDTEDTNFIYKKDEAFSLLDDVKKQDKPKVWKKKRDWLAFSITYAVQQEAEKGFFVLPIPENFLVGADSVKFVYKATEGMPITGFDATQLFSHVKRLILYLYSEESFTELLGQKEAKTSDKFLVALANAADYEELLTLIPYVLPKEQPVPKKKRAIVPKIQPKKVPAPVAETEKPLEPSNKTAENHPVTYPEKGNQPVAGRSQSVSSKRKKVVYLLGVFLVVSVFLNSYLLFDKITYPSQVQLLKNENVQLIDKVDKNEEKLSQLELENEAYEETTKELKKANEELNEEIETNVQTIKDLVDKNDELKKSIKK